MSTATTALPPIPPAPREQRPATYSPEDLLILPVWVVNPRTRIVQVFRRGNQVMRLHEHDELSEPDILPDFHCRVRDLLPPVSMMETDTAPSAAEADVTAAQAK